MNQCDINYRQSSNKRLLVELTLIEVAQLTQPEDAPGSGRKPRRLKSLFKNLIQQTQPRKAAPQVAAAKTAVSKEVKQTSTTSQTSQTSNNSSATTSPSIKAANIGFSWGSLRKKPSKINLIPGTVSTPLEQQTDAVFTQEDLELQWMSMCNRMPQEYSGIATRMKNMNPTITEFPQVEVVVDNTLIQQEMENFKGRIIKTLINSLHNESLTLEIRVAEQKNRVRLLTRREQFEALSKENPAVEKLRQEFDLELA